MKARTQISRGMKSTLVLVAIGLLTAFPRQTPGEPPPERPSASPINTDRAIRDTAVRFCFSCHGTAKQQAELNIEALLDAPGGIASQPDTLTALLRTVKDGGMPPRSAKSQPTVTERAALVAALAAVAQVPHQDLVGALKRSRVDTAREGELPTKLPDSLEIAQLSAQVPANERNTRQPPVP